MDNYIAGSFFVRFILLAYMDFDCMKGELYEGL